MQFESRGNSQGNFLYTSFPFMGFFARFPLEKIEKAKKMFIRFPRISFHLHTRLPQRFPPPPQFELSLISNITGISLCGMRFNHI